MNLKLIGAGPDAPREVNVLIEVPVGGDSIKYEFDKVAGVLVVDRFLHTSMRYPGNYGFIPETLSEDGDPCDVLVVSTRALHPGSVVRVRPIGVLLMEDEHGPDEKIIAVPTSRLTRRYEMLASVDDLPAIAREQVQHFFEHYKDLEPGKWVRVLGWGGAEKAFAMIQAAMDRAGRPDLANQQEQ